MSFIRKYSVLAFIVISVEIILLFLACNSKEDISRLPRTCEKMILSAESLTPSLFSSSEAEIFPVKEESSLSLLEKKLVSHSLVNISELDKSIIINIKYSTENNFLKKNLYGDLKKCYLQKDNAEKLVKAQKLLKEKYPFYSLVVFDGVRPLSIQKMMWDELKGVPEKNKWKYVSDPEVGSLHNYGCAVDVSIVNEEGWEMDMGTPYDYFGELGHPIAEPIMLDEGKLTWRQFENRKLLREVMFASGFTGITTEWWHFNGSSLHIAGEKYHIID